MRRALVIVATITSCLTAAACTKGTPEEELKEVIQQIPWMLHMLEECQAFKKAKMDMNKNDISSRTVNFLRGVEVKDARADVEKILPNKPENPDQYALQLTMGKGVRFASQSKDRPIRTGSEVFKQASTLEEGQCVVFSGKDLAPINTFQMGKVCTPRYYIKFTSVAPCPD